MRILCVVQHFRQGWGGAPESIRLLARILAARGVSVDVCDLGKLRRGVETLDLLPEPDEPAEHFNPVTTGDYDAVLIAGPWQNPKYVKPVLKARRQDQPLVYLPRGGLGRIEFSRLRDIKKWPYFFLIERGILHASTGVVLSSRCEQRNQIAAARGLSREVVIPDFFIAPAALARTPSEAPPAEVRFSFMAEISPRKGLLPLVQAFRLLADSPELTVPVRLVIGGSIRKGSEAYVEQARSVFAEMPAKASVEIIGPVRHGDRPVFYRDTDVFLVPSLFESYGLTVLEALAAGCATITGPELGVLEFLPSHDRLSVAESVRPEDIAVQLLRQYKLALVRGGVSREETVAYAAGAIDAINAQALDSWTALLNG